MKPLRLAKQVVDHAANVLRTFEIREMSAVLDRGQLGIRQGPGDVGRDVRILIRSTNVKVFWETRGEASLNWMGVKSTCKPS